jgi:cytochrome c551/c552
LPGLPRCVDKKVIGPSCKEVAANMLSQKDAADKLAQKIMKGRFGRLGRGAGPPTRESAMPKPRLSRPGATAK